MLYLVMKNKVYYFRIRIPKDLRQYFLSPEIKRSLHTPSYKRANSLARIFVADAEKVFMMIRSNTLTHAQIYKIIDKLLDTRLSRYDEQARKVLETGRYEELQQFTINKCDRTLKKYKELLAKNKYDGTTQNKAQVIFEANGIFIEKDSTEFNQFCKELTRSNITQYEVIKSRINGDEHPYEQELKQKKKFNTLREAITAFIHRRSKTSKLDH